MTSIAPDESLHELDTELRRVWAQYRDRLRELSPGDYERVEPESWDLLQGDLRRVQERRDALGAAAAGPPVGEGSPPRTHPPRSAFETP
jgi:hypothetical protein